MGEQNPDGKKCGPASGGVEPAGPLDLGEVEAELRRLKAGLAHVRSLIRERQIERAWKHLAYMYEQSAAVCDVAVKNGCAPMVESSKSLCYLLDRMVRPDGETLQAAGAHIRAIEAYCAAAALKQSGSELNSGTAGRSPADSPGWDQGSSRVSGPSRLPGRRAG